MRNIRFFFYIKFEIKLRLNRLVKLLKISKLTKIQYMDCFTFKMSGVL